MTIRKDAANDSACENCWNHTTRVCSRCGQRICRTCAKDHKVADYTPPVVPELWVKCE